MISSLWWTIFFTPVIVQYMEKNLDTMKIRYSKQFAIPLAFRDVKVPL